MWPLPAVRCAGQTAWYERPYRRWSSKPHAWCGLPVVWSSWGSSSLRHSVGCSNHIMPQGLPYGLLRLMCMGMDDRGTIVYRKRLSRHDLMPFIATLRPLLIGMEACGGAHDWARRFREHGHEVKLMAPQFVKLYIKSNKNDSRDAEAIAEAVTRP